MNSDRVIADAIKAAQRLLWHRYDLPDATKIVRLRKFFRSPAVQSALQNSGDTLLVSTLRAVELVVADQSRTDREMIGRLPAPDPSPGATEFPIWRLALKPR